jgi:uncharacterized membrane protein
MPDEQHPTADGLAQLADELAAVARRLEAMSAQLRAGQQAGQQASQPAGSPPSAPSWPAAQPAVWPAGPPPQWPVAPPVPQAWPPGQPSGQPLGQQPGLPPGRLPGVARWPGQPPGFGPPPLSLPPPLAPPPLGPPPPRRPGLLDREGASGRLLAWVGGTVTLLGVVLLMVLAVQRGWLGPLPRVLAGAALGLVMIGLAVRVHRLPGGRTGALALVATGAAALYLDVIAASVLYEYLPIPVGLVVGLLVAAGGLAFADRWREQLLAVAVVAGAALFAPALAGLTSPRLVAFTLVLQLAAAPVQLRRGWAGLAVAGAVPPVLAGMLCVGRAAVDGHDAATVTATIAVLIVGTVLAVLGALRAPERLVWPALLALAPAPALLMATQLARWPATALAVSTAVLAAGLWAASHRPGERFRLPARLGAVAGAIASVAAFEATVLALDGHSLTLALLAESAVLALAAWRLTSRGMLLAALGYLLAGGLLAIIREVPPAALVLFPASPYLAGGARQTEALIAGLGVSVLLVLAAAAGTVAANRLGWLRATADHAPLWLIAIGIVLYGETGAVLCAALLVKPTEGGFLAGHAVVTVSWTVAALVLLVRGITSRSLRATGLGLVAAALVKLVLFDLAKLDGIARVATFLGAGLVLLAAGVRYACLVATADDRQRDDRQQDVRQEDDRQQDVGG